MFRHRIPRQVEVDWSSRRGQRIPILEPRTYVFGEPAVADKEGRRIEGMICWDPAQGWVLDVPPAALVAALEDDAPG